MVSRKNTILVTGASGFIGRHLLPSLEEKFKVITTPSSKSFDIRNLDEVIKLPNAEFVIHLAGSSNIPLSWEVPEEALSINIIGTLNVLNYCIKNNASLIYPSSYGYGIPEYLPTDEKHPLRSENPYAISKLAAESLCEVYQKKFGLNITIFRLFNVYGPGQSEDMVIPKMISGLIKNNIIEVQTGRPKRDMVYISDVNKAFLLGLKKMQGLAIYNVGSGKSYSIKEIAKKLIKLKKKNSKYIDRNTPRLNDIQETKADISKIKKEIGWYPKISIDKGLKETYNWFLRQRMDKN